MTDSFGHPTVRDDGKGFQSARDNNKYAVWRERNGECERQEIDRFTSILEVKSFRRDAETGMFPYFLNVKQTAVVIAMIIAMVSNCNNNNNKRSCIFSTFDTPSFALFFCMHALWSIEIRRDCFDTILKSFLGEPIVCMHAGALLCADKIRGETPINCNHKYELCPYGTKILLDIGMS